VLVLCRCETAGRCVAGSSPGGAARSPSTRRAISPGSHDIRRRCQNPLADRLPDGTRPTVVRVDTLRGRVRVLRAGAAGVPPRVRAALEAPAVVAVATRDGRAARGAGRPSA